MNRNSARKWIGGASGAIVVAAMLGPIVTSASASSADASMRGAVPAHATVTKAAPSAVRQAATVVTPDQAKAAVLAQVPKARFIAIRAAQHGGYHAFAVKVERSDGSTLIGYVDRASGVVFDWSQPTAPVVPQSTSPSPAASAVTDDESDDDATETQSAHDDGDDNESEDSQFGDDENSQGGDHEDSDSSHHGDGHDSQHDDGDSDQNDD